MLQTNPTDQAFRTLPELIAEHARLRPQHPALIHDERRVGYRDFDRLVDRIAASLQRDGVQPGEAVAICAPASIEYAAVFVAALRIGCAAAPLAPSSTPESLAAMLDNCEARILFLDNATASELATLDRPPALTFVAIDGQPLQTGAGCSFEQWLAGLDARPTSVEVEPDAPFNIIYSSGTTGVPKGIVHSHAMRWVQMSRIIESGTYAPDTVSLIATPLYSNTTLVCFLPTLAAGGTVVLMEKFDVARYLSLAEKHRATVTMLVPIQYQRIMQHADFDRFDLSSFRSKFCTSAPFSAELKASILKRWPGGLTEYYGMTEGGGSCALQAHEHPHKLHTVGQPSPGHDLRVIDEQGRELPQGEVGEIVGSSAAIMTGYHRDPQRTAETHWRAPDGKLFIRTGDIGRFDEDGFLILMDRRKDMIISGGFNVYPSDLEAVLLAHPDVQEAAVFGVPSEQWGETPVAVVVTQSGRQVDPEALRQWTNARVGKTQRLAALHLAESLPRSAIGKVLKRELRDRFASAP